MKRFLLMMSIFFILFSTTAQAQNDYDWIEGGVSVDLGNIASLNLDPELAFLDGENTRNMSMDYGDPVTGLEIGSIFPMDENQSWVVYFDYEETGHIKDDEKINTKALLKSYQQGAKESNKERHPDHRIYVSGWDIEPFYDEQTHNLTWSLLLEDEDKNPFLNYNTRILTREGNISIVLVTDPENREADKKTLNEKILPYLKVKDGNRYDDFNASTDKVSEYGLSGLILGGAGLVVAKKVGLLAFILALAKKFGVFVLAGLAGIWGFIRKNKKKPISLEELDNLEPLHETEDTVEPSELNEPEDLVKK